MTNSVDFDRFTTNYNQLLKDTTQFFSASEEYFARYKVDVVRKRQQTPVHRLLEFGCGIGRNIPFLQQAFPNVEIIGSDISNASLEIAKRDNRGVRFVKEDDDAQAMGLFDVIFVAGVFHHIPAEERPEAARSLARRLAPGGALFVFEHNPFNPITRRIVNTCPYDKGVILLKPSDLRSVLTQGGLAVEHKAYCLFVPPRFSMLLPLEHWLGWIPLGGQYWVQAGHPQSALRS